MDDQPLPFSPGVAREIPDPAAEADRLATQRQGNEIVPIKRADLDILLAVAALYLEAFGADEPMSLSDRMGVQDVEQVVARHGRRH